MGRRTDYAVLWVLTAAAIFLYFLSIVQKRWMAFALTGLCIFCLGKVVRTLTLREPALTRKRRLSQARRTLERWLFLPPEECSEQIEGLLRRSGRFKATQLILVRRHASGRPLDMNDLLLLWPQLQTETAPLLACTGPISTEAARCLRAHLVEYVDEEALLGLMSREVKEIEPVPRSSRTAALRRIGDALVRRSRPWRHTLTAATLIGLYALTGVWTYLPAAAILLTLSLANLLYRRRGIL